MLQRIWVYHSWIDLPKTSNTLNVCLQMSQKSGSRAPELFWEFAQFCNVAWVQNSNCKIQNARTIQRAHYIYAQQQHVNLYFASKSLKCRLSTYYETTKTNLIRISRESKVHIVAISTKTLSILYIMTKTCCNYKSIFVHNELNISCNNIHWQQLFLKDVFSYTSSILLHPKNLEK